MVKGLRWKGVYLILRQRVWTTLIRIQHLRSVLNTERRKSRRHILIWTRRLHEWDLIGEGTDQLQLRWKEGPRRILKSKQSTISNGMEMRMDFIKINNSFLLIESPRNERITFDNNSRSIKVFEKQMLFMAKTHLKFNPLLELTPKKFNSKILVNSIFRLEDRASNQNLNQRQNITSKNLEHQNRQNTTT